MKFSEGVKLVGTEKMVSLAVVVASPTVVRLSAIVVLSGQATKGSSIARVVIIGI